MNDYKHTRKLIDTILRVIAGTVTWPVAGSKLAGKLRAPLLVHRNRKGAAALAGLEIVTTRDDRVQLIVSWASAELRNTA